MNKFEEVYCDMILEEAKTNQKLSKAQIKSLIEQILKSLFKNVTSKSSGFQFSKNDKIYNVKFGTKKQNDEQKFYINLTGKNQKSGKFQDICDLEDIIADQKRFKKAVKTFFKYQG